MKVKFIIIDLNTARSLYGLNKKTLTFDTPNEAHNLAKQLCPEYIVVSINLNLNEDE